MRDIVQAEPSDTGYLVRLVTNGREIGRGLTAAEAHAWVATVNARGAELADSPGDSAAQMAFALRLKTAALDRLASGRARYGVAEDADGAP